MSKADSIGQLLAALNSLRDNLHSNHAKALLRKSLTEQSNRVVGRAAELTGEAKDEGFIEDLLTAYHRLMIDPLKKDSGCIGKTAIMRTLVALRHDDVDIYRNGVEYEQSEPVWGGQKDCAAELRGLCAMGLISCANSLEILNRCAVLLTDPCVEARAGAARALAASAIPEAGPLLRLKLLVGDAAPDVVGECCFALLQLDRERAVDFVVALLSSQDSDVCVQAGMALGESRRPETFEPLRTTWERKADPVVRESLLLCIGLLRSSESADFLLSLIDAKDLRAADDAIKALRLHGKVGELREKIEAAVNSTGNSRLRITFKEEWGDA